MEEDGRKSKEEDDSNGQCRKEKNPFARYLQNTPLKDTRCPKSEPYVSYANIYQDGAFFRINDIKLRKSDRMQYVTGYFKSYQSDSSKCFIAKITSRGDFEDA